MTNTNAMTSPNILLVDDDKSLCQLLQEYLSSEDFDVSYVNDGQAAIDHLTTENDIHIVVLDIMMPKVSGLDVLMAIRKNDKVRDLPVIMLTGKGDDIDRIVGLEMGADDYLGKPCNPRELSARIRAILRRTHVPQIEAQDNEAEVALCSHGLALDPSSLSVEMQETQQHIEFTGVEFQVLHLLMQHAGQLLSKAELTEKVLHRKLGAHDRSIDVHISRIRQKLAKDADIHNIIKSVRGSGYMLVKESEHDPN